MEQARGVRQLGDTDRLLGLGIFAGMLAAAVMGLFSVVASAAWLQQGFFTPAYRVAALVDPSFQATSLDHAARGDAFYFERAPVVFGTVIHLAVGAFFGAVFVLVCRAARLRGRALLAAGTAYGLALLALVSVALLPAAARMVGEPQLSHLPGATGWAAVVLAHALFGLVLGWWVLRRPQDLTWAEDRAAGAPPG